MVGAVFGWYWGLGLFLFAMFCVFVGVMASAPYKQRNEAREAVTHLLFAMQPTETVRSLLLFYDEATKLMIREITSDETSDVLKKDVDDWWKRCGQWVKSNVSITEGVLFSRVIANPTMKFEKAYNEKHNKSLEFLHYASEQVKQLINRLQKAS